MLGAYSLTIETAALVQLVSLSIDDSIAGDEMSAIPTHEMERNLDTTGRQGSVYAGRLMRVKLCARCPYTPRDLAGHYDPKGPLHVCAKCDGQHEANTNHYPRRPARKEVCATEVERNRDNPDGRDHLCAPPPNALRPSCDIVSCFASGSAT
jgi:hypothetical protein